MNRLIMKIIAASLLHSNVDYVQVRVYSCHFQCQNTKTGLELISMELEQQKFQGSPPP